MSNSSQHIKLGLFVICTTILLAAAIIVLAGRRWGVKEFPAYTSLQESVQGLEVGSPVKFRGVPIGSVRRITIQDEDLEVRVDMELYEGSIQVENKTICQFLQEQVRHGARCRLELTGITGFKYIEIEMLPEDKLEKSAVKRASRKGALYIPAVRSVLAGVTADVSYTLAEIAEIDFKSIGQNVDQLLTSFNHYVEGERIGDVIDNLAKTSEQLSSLSEQLNTGGVDETMQKIKDTLDNLNGLISDVHGEVKKAEIADLATEVREAANVVSVAAKSFNQFSETADRVVADSKLPETMTGARRTLAEIQTTLNETAASLQKTLNALTRFAEMLEQDTDALIRGKQIPEVHMGRD